MLDVAELRRQLSSPRVIGAALGLDRGAQRQRGDAMTVFCPWHKEKTPSCSITRGDDGTLRAHCFGCKTSGDVLSLIAAQRGFDIKTQFREVLEEAASIAGGDWPDLEPQPEQGEPECLSPASYNAIANALLELCPIVNEPDVIGYCERRVLLLEGAQARVGALPERAGQQALIEKLLCTFSAETLEAAGLLWRDRDTDALQLEHLAFPENRLVLPWQNLDGTISALQRRRLDDRKGGRYVFPRGIKPSLPFGAERLRAHGADRILVLCEGAIDTLALRMLGRRDRMSLLPLGVPGLDGWRSDWARFAKGREVWIGFDADAPAELAAERVSADLYTAGASSVVRWTPQGAKDWAELSQRRSHYTWSGAAR